MKERIVTYALIGTLALVSGVLAVSYIRLYQKYYAPSGKAPLQQLLDTIGRGVRIVAVDAERRYILVEVPSISQSGNLALHVPENAAILSQQPILNDGIIVGFEDEQPARFEDIAPGQTAYVIFSLGTGAFEAKYVILGNPFPRN